MPGLNEWFNYADEKIGWLVSLHAIALLMDRANKSITLQFMYAQFLFLVSFNDYTETGIDYVHVVHSYIPIDSCDAELDET